MAISSATGTSGEVPRLSFDGKDAPIRSVVVYTNNMAEIKRVLSFSATATGVQEVRVSVRSTNADFVAAACLV